MVKILIRVLKTLVQPAYCIASNFQTTCITHLLRIFPINTLVSGSITCDLSNSLNLDLMTEAAFLAPLLAALVPAGDQSHPNSPTSPPTLVPFPPSKMQMMLGSHSFSVKFKRRYYGLGPVLGGPFGNKYCVQILAISL